MSARALRLVALGAVALASAGCPKRGEPTGGSSGAPGATGASGAAGATGDAPDAAPTAALDFVARFDDCALGHHGPLVDLGDATARASFAGKSRGDPPESTERDGATWAKVTSKSLTVSFVLDAMPSAYQDPIVSARVRGGSARSVSVYLNDKAVGLWNLAKGEAKVVEARGAEDTLLPGENTVTMRFNGAGRASADELAEIDWVHVGDPDPDGAYSAPTRADALVSVAVGGVTRRAISLRAPGFVRCGGVVPSGGELEMSVGLAGASDGELEVRLLRDRVPPQTLATVRLGPGDAGAWRPVKVPLGDIGPGPQLGAIALVAKSVTKGGRVLFAEPRVTTRAAPPAARAMPPARGVVLVVLGDLSPRGLALYGGARALPALDAIASAGVAFDAARATTTVPAGSVASMLTGLQARAHGVSEYDKKLPADVTTLADAARQGGVVAAMFTANPLTGAAFGFDRAWETFEAHPPTEDAPATLVFDRAASWIEAHKGERFFVVVHARGGHPPWDATPDQLKTLAPDGYTGGIDPKHAAELLAKARRVPPVLRYGDQDRARTWALYDVALATHDAALGRLAAALKSADREADTALIVTSDVSVDEAAHVPFGDGETLDEAPLRVPLVVRAASASGAPTLAGKHVTGAVSGADVARSVLGALGLAPPASFGGVDLWATATRPSGREGDDARPLLASLGERTSLRWGTFVRMGTMDRDPKLCNLALEPVCITDVRQTHPLASEALERAVLDELARAPRRTTRESPSIDATTAAALKAWGR